MRKGLIVSVIMAASLVMSIVRSEDRPRRLTVYEARNLVLAALPSKTTHLPKFGVDQYQDKNLPRFYFFEALWEGAPNGSAVIGHYAVDSSTGDVFSAITTCDEKSTPALRKLQAKVRLRIGLSDSEYHKIKTKGPLCL